MKTTRVINKNCQLNFELIDLTSVNTVGRNHVSCSRKVSKVCSNMATTISMILIQFLQPNCKNIKNEKRYPISYRVLYVLDVNIVKIRENIGNQFSKSHLSTELGICNAGIGLLLANQNSKGNSYALWNLFVISFHIPAVVLYGYCIMFGRLNLWQLFLEIT